MKSNKGITLIVLVITIIVLLVLASVAIASLTGNNNIINRAQEAKTKTEAEQANEEAKIDEYAVKIEEKTTGGGTGYSGPNVWQTEFGLTAPGLVYNYDYVGNYVTMAFLSDGSVYGSGGSMPASDIRESLEDPNGPFKVYGNYCTLQVSESQTIKYVINGNTIDLFINDEPLETLTLSNNPRNSI